MSRKSKGINAERDLIHKFWKSGWAASRVAGSGSIKYPSPDVIAGNNLRKLAIECKTSKDKVKYLTTEEIMDLKQYSIIFGAEAWIAVKFDRMEWFFLTLEDIRETERSYMVSEEIVKNKGLLFEEVIK